MFLAVVPTLLFSADGAVALAIVAAAAGWLVWRGVRALRGSHAGCGCGKGAAPTASGRDAEEVRAAAERVNRERSRGAR